MPVPAGPPVSRRAALAALASWWAAAALPGLTGCTAGSTPTQASPGGPATADPVALLRVESAAAEQRLVTLYDDVLAAHPSLGPRLLPLRAHHVAHGQALRASTTSAPSAAATPTPTAPRRTAPTTGAPATAAPPATVPADPQAALELVAAGERGAAAAAATAAGRAGDPELARLLASVAAAEAVHADVLGAP